MFVARHFQGCRINSSHMLLNCLPDLPRRTFTTGRSQSVSSCVSFADAYIVLRRVLSASDLQDPCRLGFRLYHACNSTFLKEKSLESERTRRTICVARCREDFTVPILQRSSYFHKVQLLEIAAYECSLLQIGQIFYITLNQTDLFLVSSPIHYFAWCTGARYFLSSAPPQKKLCAPAIYGAPYMARHKWRERNAN